MQTANLRKGILLASVAMLFVFSIFFALPLNASAASTTNVTIYAHKNTSTINSGVVANTTTLYSSSAQTSSSTAVTSTAPLVLNWFLSPALAGSLSVVASTMTANVYVSGNDSSATLTASLRYGTTSAPNTAIGSGTLSPTTITSTASKFAVSATLSAVTIPSGDSLNFSLAVAAPSTHVETYTISYDTSAANTNFIVPLSSPPVVINSLSLSPQSITNPATSLATVSVSDAFGVYDIASAKLSASIQGVTPINAQLMSAASGNSPTAYTGSFTTHVNPSATTYSSFSGSWSVTSTVTDQSGNTYTSVPALLSYSGSSGGCVYCSSTTSTIQGVGGLPSISFAGELLIFAALVLIAVAVVFAVKRR